MSSSPRSATSTGSTIADSTARSPRATPRHPSRVRSRLLPSNSTRPRGGYPIVRAVTEPGAIQGVRVNGIGPDMTETPQVRYSEWVPKEQQPLWPVWVPVGRVGEPVDQARVLLFLASDLSAFVTGLTIPTDGGTQAAGGWYRSNSRGPDRPAWTNRPLSP